MDFLNFRQCEEWCSKNGISFLKDGDNNFSRPDLESFPYKLEYEMPQDSGEKVCLAKEIYSAIGASDDYLIWLRNWAVWPSSCHMPLFLKLRKSLGCDLSLINAPGHRHAVNEVEDGISIVLIALTFFWDCYLMPASGKKLVFISHDGCYTFFSHEKIER